MADVVLLINSDPEECNILQRALQLRGYAVLTAPNPSAAIVTAALFAKPIRLLLVDSGCAGKQTDLLSQQISGRGSPPAVLVMSDKAANGEPSKHQIIRPFTPSALAREISTLLGGQQ